MAAEYSSVLALFCGLPASGKTTLVQDIKTMLESRQGSAARSLSWRPCVIRYDDLVGSDTQVKTASIKGLAKECRQHVLDAADRYIGWLCGGCLEQSRPEPSGQGPVDAMLGYLVAATKQTGPGEKLLIMVDDNLYYRSMRAAWFRLARSYSLGFCQVFLLCPTEDAVHRNAARSAPVPEQTITTMAEKFELPRSEPWEERTVMVNGGQGSLEEVMALVEAVSKEPWSPVETASVPREPVPASQLHIWDLELRAIVAKFINQAQAEKSCKSELQAWCIQVQKARQNVLAYIRAQHFDHESKQISMESLMREQLCGSRGSTS